MEKVMRGFLLALLGLVAAAAMPPLAMATPSPPSEAAAASDIVPAASRCPQGQRWVPAGYAKHGKYRAGHCSPN